MVFSRLNEDKGAQRVSRFKYGHLFTVPGIWFLLGRAKAGREMAHILLAEDDESLRKFLAAALVKAGHAVSDFGDGGDAYECLKGDSFDLLLTDIVMPGMDGIELAKRAAELNDGLKIMFITGFAAVALHPSSNAPKQAKVLSKPFHLREIVAEVERMIAA
jgi:two-component system cell cycle response regulator CpdR